MTYLEKYYDPSCKRILVDWAHFKTIVTPSELTDMLKSVHQDLDIQHLEIHEFPGEIPWEIFNAQKLLHLHIGNCKGFTELPKQLDLPNLAVLSLYNCPVKRIPSELMSKMPKIRIITALDCTEMEIIPVNPIQTPLLIASIIARDEEESNLLQFHSLI